MRINDHVSSRIYTFLLNAYPSDFRDEYGWLMTQAFRDRYRDEASRPQKSAIITYWFTVLCDLAVTATKEHGQNIRKGDRFMNNLRKDLVAVAGTVVIIVAALALLNYGRSHEVASILVVGRVLDAIVTAGVLGNLIVFLLVKFSKWNSLRIALWTFLVVHAVLLTIIAIIGPQTEPHFTIGPNLVAYVLSFLFWFGLHWAWRAMRPEVASS
jgi:hypothetical protein